MEEDHCAALRRTEFGIPDIQDAGVNLLQRAEGVRAGGLRTSRRDGPQRRRGNRHGRRAQEPAPIAVARHFAAVADVVDRSERKAARSSVVKSAGCSHAAK